MRTATFTQTNNVVAGYTKMSIAAIMIFGSVFFSGCSNDESSPLAASIDGKDAVSENVAMPKTFSDKPTIEITGKASFDIVTLNEKVIAEYNYTAVPARKALLKTGAELLADNLFDSDFPYKGIAEKILGKGEDWLDGMIDGYTMGMWSKAKNALLGWLFPEEKSEFNVEEAFQQVNAQLANIEAILQEMRSEIDNQFAKENYGKKLEERKNLYSVLKCGLDELNGKIISINNDNVKYPTDEDKYEALKVAVKKWGDESVGSAVAVMPARQHAINLIELITKTTNLPGKDARVSDFLSIYDQYADRSLVWEQEGYVWRALMRAQDAKMVMQLAIASVLYYSLIDDNPDAVERIYKNIAEYRNVVDANPIVRHSTPIYIKYGSKYRGQIFSGELKQIKYNEVLRNKWLYSGSSSDKQADKKYALNHNTYKWNASRLYAGAAPKSNKDAGAIWSDASNMGMPEDFYNEIYEAYKVNGHYKSLMDVFKSVGFKSGATGVYKKGENEQYFVTSYLPHTVTRLVSKTKAGKVSGSRDKYSWGYKIGVSAVLANTEGNARIALGLIPYSGIGVYDDINTHTVDFAEYSASLVTHHTSTKGGGYSEDVSDRYAFVWMTKKEILEKTALITVMSAETRAKAIEQADYAYRSFFIPVKTNKVEEVK